MGTSSSSKGMRGKNPLVPEWADDQPGVALPESDPNRFRSFRTHFGNYVSGSGRTSLEKSLGKFAAQATGGSTVGPRRLGAIISAGGHFAEALRDISQGQDVVGLKKSEYEGKSAEHFAQALADLIKGDTPDADWIASAAQEAIEAVFDIDEAFEPENLTEDNVTIILAEFLSISIFQLVLNEAGDSWNRVSDTADAISFENEILDLTREIVDQSLRAEIQGGNNRMTSDAAQHYLRATAKDVWEKWERYSV